MTTQAGRKYNVLVKIWTFQLELPQKSQISPLLSRFLCLIDLSYRRYVSCVYNICYISPRSRIYPIYWRRLRRDIAAPPNSLFRILGCLRAAAVGRGGASLNLQSLQTVHRLCIRSAAQQISFPKYSHFLLCVVSSKNSSYLPRICFLKKGKGRNKKARTIAKKESRRGRRAVHGHTILKKSWYFGRSGAI